LSGLVCARHRLTRICRVELSPEKARHIEYGYAVDGARRVAADRVLVTGETSEPKPLAAVLPGNRDLPLYISAETISRQQEQSPTLKSSAIFQVQQQPLRRLQDFDLGF